MPKIKPFENFSQEYELWFLKHTELYEAEVKAIKKLLPPFKNGIEIGVGSGQFAIPLDIKTGVEPSSAMAKIAETKGIKIIKGVAENIPLADEKYDFVLMVTTICFVDDPLMSLKNIYRILEPKGAVIIGFVDKNSQLGKLYEQNSQQSRFYKEAHFYTAEEIINLLEKVGFSHVTCVQTLFGNDVNHMNTAVKKGYGEGAFVAILAHKE
ncbi:class I SAM-dependent methyltransferase [Sulfurimonas autotrophica]|uniref:Methyltransferase type 11 n=1 Tax=Sulfurimonas autotrophica (strain ATCC BAA-671 / DSM 16294 / JCM 11897 / OK10) TaxID=563040 RepID=E0UQR4_SULAO|nr:class I SAM-dependent methyltransferase [Sulfurimonas autotrophica]ADN09936.1 Methyltransferase type 11 [Sulfurimonas autotrophica DSM 16294]